MAAPSSVTSPCFIDVDDDQTVGSQWARTHGFRDRLLQLHIIGLFCGRLGQFVGHSQR